MTQQEFLKQIAAGRAGGVWLLHGEEEPMKQEAVRRLKEALLDPSLADLNCVTLTSPEPDDVIGACETVPVLSDYRLVIVRDFAAFRKKGESEDGADEDAKEKSRGKKKDPQQERFTGYIAQVPMSTVLLFWETGKVAGTNGLLKRIAKEGREVLCARLTGEELITWITERFRAGGKLCPRPTAQALTFVSGRDSLLLDKEIEKLCAYVGDRSGVTEDDIYEAATRSTEYSVFRMLDCVVAGSEARALEALRLMLLGGESPAGILAMLLRQYRLLQMIRIMQFSHLTNNEISQRTGLAGFPLSQYLKQADQVKNAEVKRAVRLLLDAEFAFKSGRLPEKGLAETVVLQLLSLRHQYRQ